jgi:hypothetical protein
MSPITTTTIAAFKPVERDYLRQQLGLFFSTLRAARPDLMDPAGA